jgi:hypothetical protein
MVQTQMAPNQSMPEDGNPSANDIGAAIRWLDMGANGQAMQAIIRAINYANAAEAPPHPWSGYPGQPPSYYSSYSMQ